MDKTKIIVLVLLLISCRLLGQTDNSDDLMIKINQEISPGANPEIIYEINKKKLSIYKIAYGKNSKLTKKKKIYSDKLDEKFIDTLIFKIDNSDIAIFDSTYSSGVLDGIWWKYEIKTTKTKKEIYLDNYYLPELGLVLDFINNRIPQKYRLIKFEYLGIKDRFTDDKNKN